MLPIFASKIIYNNNYYYCITAALAAQTLPQAVTLTSARMMQNVFFCFQLRKYSSMQNVSIIGSLW
jgi:hypothetical protein